MWVNVLRWGTFGTVRLFGTTESSYPIFLRYPNVLRLDKIPQSIGIGFEILYAFRPCETFRHYPMILPECIETTQVFRIPQCIRIRFIPKYYDLWVSKKCYVRK